jgi:hypothetical protein
MLLLGGFLKMEAVKTKRLREVVLMWTLLTTTFFWTSTMRILLKPEISSWKIFSVGGKGALGEYWLPPLIVIIALFGFYLEGRGRLRTFYHFLLIAWHLIITAVCVYGVFQTNAMISFGTWGITLSLNWLLAPFLTFLILSIILVIQENRHSDSIPVFGWDQINLKFMVLALILFPLALFLFQIGEGFDLKVKLAVIVTIIQWIILAQLPLFSNNSVISQGLTSLGTTQLISTFGYAKVLVTGKLV